MRKLSRYKEEMYSLKRQNLLVMTRYSSHNDLNLCWYEPITIVLDNIDIHTLAINIFSVLVFLLKDL